MMEAATRAVQAECYQPWRWRSCRCRGVPAPTRSPVRACSRPFPAASTVTSTAARSLPRRPRSSAPPSGCDVSGERSSSEAAELGGAAQGVGHAAGGPEGVDQAEEEETAAVDAEHGRARLVADGDAGVHERALAHHDPAAAIALHLVAGAEPAAEHGDDL